MKTIIILFLVFISISFVSLSSETATNKDAIEEPTRKRPKIVFAKPEPVCSGCGGQEPELKETECHHLYHYSCINKYFLGTYPFNDVKCRKCDAKINYEWFIRTLITLENIPEDISYIQGRLSDVLIPKLAEEVIKSKNALRVRNLLKLKIPINNYPIKENFSVLNLAAHSSTPEILEILLQSGLKFVPFNFSNVDRLFHIAIYSKNLENIKYLLTKGAQINLLDPSTTKAPLHSAIYLGNIEAVKFLIEKNANLNLESEKSGFPIYLAIERGFDEVVELLVKAGANTTLYYNNRTPLISACYLNKPGAVKILIEHGCPTDSFTQDGFNLLHYSIFSGSVQVVEYLMSRNFSIERKDRTHCYALHRATHHGRIAMIKYLLSIGANPYEKSDHSTLATVRTGKPDFAQSFNINDPAIVISIIYGNHELTDTYLNAGVDPNTRIQNNSSSLLHLAVQAGNCEICKLLIRRGADIHALDSLGRTPLSYTTQEWDNFLSLEYSKSL